MSPEAEKGMYSAIAVLVFAWLLVSVWRDGKRKAEKAWIEGFREATRTVSFGVSQWYEHDGLPIPEEVEEAIVAMERAERRQDHSTIQLGLGGAAIAFGDAMGKAAQQRGLELAALGVNVLTRRTPD